MDQGSLVLALIAGAVAAFNPCGFALLPAYLALLVAEGPGTGRGSRAVAVARAVRFSAGMTVGFVAVFGLFGAVITSLAVSVEAYLPVLTVVIGVVLVGLGGWLLADRSLAVPGLAGRGRAPAWTWGSQIGYGVSFALASLSCTIAPFLAVTAGSLRGAGVWGIAGSYLAYALGMGTVVLTLALAVATARSSVTVVMRRAGPVISWLAGVLLLVAGAYVAWYGWFELRVLAGSTTTDPVVSAAVGVQATIVQWISGLGAGPIIGVAVALAVLASVLTGRRVLASPSDAESDAGPTPRS
ncbi:MAG: cytochrome c biogenesis protein CcdA [Actinobacteria bacterium]|nr:cytochrome c biogenesis protein CcdA [Actinomycetota bacterium]